MTAIQRPHDYSLELAKWLAILTMVIDHAGFIFSDKVDYLAWRSIGRLCWPLIIWVAANRLASKPERAGGYLRRLLPWALIAQAPYAFIFNIFREPVALPWYGALNILVTMAAGCSILILLDLFNQAKAPALRLIAALAIALLVLAGTHMDYGAIGVVSLPVVVLLIRQNRPLWQIALACGVLASAANLSVLLADAIFMDYWPLFAAPLFAAPFILALIRAPLPVFRLPRWFFYFFYPFHFVVLVLLRVILFPVPVPN